MLSIGEFSGICKVSTKTLRYYAEIGLLKPDEVNPENGYRYYAIEQLERMLLINRLKSYNFSLDEIKSILESDEPYEARLNTELVQKKKELEKRLKSYQNSLNQIESDITNIRNGKKLMSYLEKIDVRLVEVPMMRLLSIRKTVPQSEIRNQYPICFNALARKIANDRLTPAAPPMVLFHSSEFLPEGLDIEFAIPVKNYVTGTRDFTPGLSLKTVLKGSYSELPSIYSKQRKWADAEGYLPDNAMFEVYVTDPSMVEDESDLITEVYSPVRIDREKRNEN